MAYVNVSADDWFDEASDGEREEMLDICKDYFKDDVVMLPVPPAANSIMHHQYNEKLDELKSKWYSLPQETINLIMSI